MNVSIATTHRRGAYRKDIQVLTNDPVNKEITFSVQATILETLSVMPAYVDFGRVPAGARKVIEISLRNNGSEPLMIKKLIASPAESFHISPPKSFSLKPGEKMQLALTLTASQRTGIIDGFLLIKTDTENLPEKSISVRAEIAGSR